MLEDFAPDMRQNGRSCAAVEESRCPQRSLEVLHSPGDGRLSEVKAKGSAIDRAGFGDGDECGDLLQGHKAQA